MPMSKYTAVTMDEQNAAQLVLYLQAAAETAVTSFQLKDQSHSQETINNFGRDNQDAVNTPADITKGSDCQRISKQVSEKKIFLFLVKKNSPEVEVLVYIYIFFNLLIFFALHGTFNIPQSASLSPWPPLTRSVSVSLVLCAGLASLPAERRLCH